MLNSAHAREYSVCFEHRPGYLYVMVDVADATYEIVRRYWSEIIAMQHRRGYDRVLVMNDIANELPTTELYTFVSELAASGLKGVDFAIVPRKYDIDACEFEEMVGTNRGLSLRVCGTLEHAEHSMVRTPPNSEPMRMAFAT